MQQQVITSNFLHRRPRPPTAAARSTLVVRAIDINGCNPGTGGATSSCSRSAIWGRAARGSG